MLCYRCNNEIEDDAKFCKHCGARTLVTPTGQEQPKKERGLK